MLTKSGVYMYGVFDSSLHPSVPPESRPEILEGVTQLPYEARRFYSWTGSVGMSTSEERAVGGDILRTNDALIPMPLEGTWTMEWGTDGAGTLTSVDVNGALFKQAEWDTAPSGGGRRMLVGVVDSEGQHIEYSTGGEVFVSADVAYSRSIGIQIQVDFYNETTYLDSVISPETTVSTDNTNPTRLSFTTPTATAGTSNIRVYIVVPDGVTVLVDDILWVSRLLVGSEGTYFDGNTANIV